MDKETIEQKKIILDELADFDRFITEKWKSGDLQIKDIRVQLKNKNIYINVIAEEEKLGYPVLKAVPEGKYEYINEVELRTYNRKDKVKAVFVIYDYEKKGFRFGNPLKVSKIDEISKSDRLPP